MGLVRDNTPPVSEQPWSILIADDDAPTRILLRAAISQWGYKIIEAKNGEDAWNIMQQADAPRITILDWLMPGLNGIELCKRIKNEISLYTYIILLTQQTGPANLITGLEAGADEFLSKPFNMTELRNRLTIGARILQYERELKNQNIILQENIRQVDSILSDSSVLLDKIKQSSVDNSEISLLEQKMGEIKAILKIYNNK